VQARWVHTEVKYAINIVAGESERTEISTCVCWSLDIRTHMMLDFERHRNDWYELRKTVQRR